MSDRPRKLLNTVRETIRLKHYSPRTEESYVHWIKRSILFHRKRHPREMGAAEIEAFLTYLAADQRVAASTQNQALSAILFLYRHVLKQELDGGVDAVRARESKRLPTVLTREETFRVIGFLQGTHQLMAKLLRAAACGCRNACSCASRTLIFEKRQPEAVQIRARRALLQPGGPSYNPEGLCRSPLWGRMILEVLTSSTSTPPNAGFARSRKNMRRISMLNSTNPELT